MRGNYGVQSFHSGGTWQPFPQYQGLPIEKAMELARELAQNTYAWPFGLRVTGPGEWKSDRIGGRPEIELSVNPITGIHTVKCTKCTREETSNDPYYPTQFGRKHRC